MKNEQVEVKKLKEQPAATDESQTEVELLLLCCEPLFHTCRLGEKVETGVVSNVQTLTDDSLVSVCGGSERTLIFL